MKILEPSVELWQQTDPIAHVARCARVCYGNKGKSTDQQLYDSLLKSGHNSMFRHETVCARIPNREMIQYKETFSALEIGSPWVQVKCGTFTTDIVTNGNFMIDIHHSPLWYLIKEYQVAPLTFDAFENGETTHSMMRYTFHITTQISTSRELNRVSPNNIAERSTRYCTEEGVICRPHWMSQKVAENWDDNGLMSLVGNHFTTNEEIYLRQVLEAFGWYHQLITNGMTKQDARGVLPLDTATEVVYTYSISEWKHIIKLRSAKSAHPNAQMIANTVKEQLEQLGYNFN